MNFTDAVLNFTDAVLNSPLLYQLPTSFFFFPGDLFVGEYVGSTPRMQSWQMKAYRDSILSLSQLLTFKLLGIRYLVGKIEFKLLFHGPKWLSKHQRCNNAGGDWNPGDRGVD